MTHTTTSRHMPVNNHPDLWRAALPAPDAHSHKFTRGHLVMLGGAQMTGAARLASEAAMRIGAGLCTIVSPPDALIIYKESAPHVLSEPLLNKVDFTAHLNDPRRTAALIGPGAGRDDEESLRQLTLTALAAKRPTVIDADALTAFAQNPEALFTALNNTCILTPHEGEFARLFPTLSLKERAHAARDAAHSSHAIIVLKGAETIIAHPDGRMVMNNHSSPYLATAGSGDVLAGVIAGLLAQGMDPFAAACAAVWIHGDVAIHHGAGLVAPDITAGIPDCLNRLSR